MMPLEAIIPHYYKLITCNFTVGVCGRDRTTSRFLRGSELARRDGEAKCTVAVGKAEGTLYQLPVQRTVH